MTIFQHKIKTPWSTTNFGLVGFVVVVVVGFARIETRIEATIEMCMKMNERLSTREMEWDIGIENGGGGASSSAKGKPTYDLTLLLIEYIGRILIAVRVNYHSNGEQTVEPCARGLFSPIVQKYTERKKKEPKQQKGSQTKQRSNQPTPLPIGPLVRRYNAIVRNQHTIPIEPWSSALHVIY